MAVTVKNGEMGEPISETTWKFASLKLLLGWDYLSIIFQKGLIYRFRETPYQSECLAGQTEHELADLRNYMGIGNASPIHLLHAFAY